MTSRRIVIGIDQGTTNTKAVALGESATVLAEASRPIVTAAPRPGWVEQDPQAMVANVVACVREVLDKADRSPREVAGLGIANQTETLVVWQARTGRAAMPAIVWQCRRGETEIAPQRTPDKLALIKSRTGLDLDPTFTAAKLRWVFERRPDIASGLSDGRLLFGTVDTWLLWSLTGGGSYATDPGNASRTMLFDIDRLGWDPELLDLFSLRLARLPECRPSNTRFGETAAFGEPIPITAVMGDQQASLFGHGCFAEGQVKVTYGTGAFLWMNAGHRPRPAPAEGIVRTVAWQMERPTYAFEGFVMYAGRILEWLARRLAVEGGAAGVAAEAERAGSSEGVRLLPAFQGLASPWWRPDLRAALVGLSEATSNGHIAHAGLEAVCYQVRLLIEAIRDKSGAAPAPIRVDGGMTRSHYFLKLQADVLGLPLLRSSRDSTPFGAALMAGFQAGFWSSIDDLSDLNLDAGRIDPDPSAAAALGQGYRRWLDAIETLAAEQPAGAR